MTNKLTENIIVLAAAVLLLAVIVAPAYLIPLLSVIWSAVTQ